MLREMFGECEACNHLDKEEEKIEHHIHIEGDATRINISYYEWVEIGNIRFLEKSSTVPKVLELTKRNDHAVV